jgi:hypothetical protein
MGARIMRCARHPGKVRTRVVRKRMVRKRLEKMPPSSRIFCPVMKPAWVEHRNAQVAPNSSAWPSRRAGIAARRCFSRLARR